ncbi:CAP domain-containing protein [Micromonospora sp. R77]|uniref:CAP domain-containing protein n=1 Tax=Micromonospora sp. R77 TaxID=2925836 RepID=UPI001F61C5AD|nr:CAP domain-containing protein [Micromonospora sp. R77]MCI4061434.1 CAP domain-containing protein [Micromonospora sp. R77]
MFLAGVAVFVVAMAAGAQTMLTGLEPRKQPTTVWSAAPESTAPQAADRVVPGISVSAAAPSTTASSVPSTSSLPDEPVASPTPVPAKSQSPRTGSRPVESGGPVRPGRPQVTGGSSRPGGTSAGQVNAEAERWSLTLLNEERAKVGLPPVAQEGDLSQFARRWAELMRRTSFHHSGSERDYLVRGQRTTTSENIVWWSDGDLNAEQAARRLQDMWRTSPGHYKNQTTREWTEVGVGLYHDSSGWWGVHVFSNG